MTQNVQTQRNERTEASFVTLEPEPTTKDGRPMTPAEIILERHARGAWYEWT